MEKTFYSLAPGLVCYAGKVEMRNIEGSMRAWTPPRIGFSPFSKELNGKKVGFYSTSDPEEIAYLEKRIAESKDVISEEEFARLAVPSDVRANTAEQKLRELEEENRLLRMLRDQIEAKAASPAPAPAPDAMPKPPLPKPKGA
jgi:hypothetical protein